MKKNEKKAVALRYPKGSDLPFISAKSKGALAERLLEIAKQNNVPIVENSFASDILSVQEIGFSIPEETWEIVAKIFAVIVKSEKKG